MRVLQERVQSYLGHVYDGDLVKSWVFYRNQCRGIRQRESQMGGGRRDLTFHI